MVSDRKRAEFAERMQWRTCTHRRVRQRPLNEDEDQMFEEGYCDLSLDNVEPMGQWCRRDNCPYLHRPDVP